MHACDKMYGQDEPVIIISTIGGYAVTHVPPKMYYCTVHPNRLGVS